MAGRAVKKAPKKKNGYKLPDPIPRGEIITDISKKQWIIGESIGLGGFGEIYSGTRKFVFFLYPLIFYLFFFLLTAAPYLGKTPKDYSFVVKIVSWTKFLIR